MAGVGSRHYHLAAAGGDRAAHQHERGDVEPALAAEHDVGQGDGAGRQQGGEQQRAHRVDGVESTQFGRRQIRRKVKCQYAEHRQDREE